MRAPRTNLPSSLPAVTIMAMTMTTSERTGIPADTFANRLLLSRAYAGHLSIREAAERCGLGRGAWQNWEKGTRPDDYDGLVELIAETLGVSREWLRSGGELAQSSTQARPARWARHRRVEVTVTQRQSRQAYVGHGYNARPDRGGPPPGPRRTALIPHQTHRVTSP